MCSVKGETLEFYLIFFVCLESGVTIGVIIVLFREGEVFSNIAGGARGETR